MPDANDRRIISDISHLSLAQTLHINPDKGSFCGLLLCNAKQNIEGLVIVSENWNGVLMNYHQWIADSKNFANRRFAVARIKLEVRPHSEIINLKDRHWSDFRYRHASSTIDHCDRCTLRFTGNYHQIFNFKWKTFSGKSFLQKSYTCSWCWMRSLFSAVLWITYIKCIRNCTQYEEGRYSCRDQEDLWFESPSPVYFIQSNHFCIFRQKKLDGLWRISKQRDDPIAYMVKFSGK